MLARYAVGGLSHLKLEWAVVRAYDEPIFQGDNVVLSLGYVRDGSPADESTKLKSTALSAFTHSNQHRSWTLPAELSHADDGVMMLAGVWRLWVTGRCCSRWWRRSWMVVMRACSLTLPASSTSGENGLCFSLHLSEHSYQALTGLSGTISACGTSDRLCLPSWWRTLGRLAIETSMVMQAGLLCDHAYFSPVSGSILVRCWRSLLKQRSCRQNAPLRLPCMLRCKESGKGREKCICVMLLQLSQAGIKLGQQVCCCLCAVPGKLYQMFMTLGHHEVLMSAASLHQDVNAVLMPAHLLLYYWSEPAFDPDLGT